MTTTETDLDGDHCRDCGLSQREVDLTQGELCTGCLADAAELAPKPVRRVVSTTHRTSDEDYHADRAADAYERHLDRTLEHGP